MMSHDREIQNHLRKMFGKQPVLSVKIDPSLIAGIVVRVGDRVYDGSVQTQLEHTRLAMIHKASEQIDIRPERFVVALGRRRNRSCFRPTYLQRNNS